MAGGLERVIGIMIHLLLIQMSGEGLLKLTSYHQSIVVVDSSPFRSFGGTLKWEESRESCRTVALRRLI
ncbi:hypothetical protein [Candidatus Chlamydia corallus]|uniref:hypothetical protein n=1 Tax=Candidatus Chlamydia corallus TaxID=2038470 RepID=UPI000C2FB478|nr:hypothetical protein [Candidatus Chlamydia corallus]